MCCMHCYVVPVISSTDKSVPESIGTTDVCVTLLNEVEMDFQVSYSTTDGSAQSMMKKT